MGEIAAASSEQATGIEQVNKAVAEMDKVTQQNAASAEESASASEEMNGQAEQMKAFVLDLVQLVGGSGAGADHSAGSQKKKIRQHAVKAPTVRTKALTAPRRKVSPEAVIPMGDEDFTDF